MTAPQPPDDLRDRFAALTERWRALDDTAAALAAEQDDLVADWQRWTHALPDEVPDEEVVAVGVDLGHDGLLTAASVIAHRALVGLGPAYEVEELRDRGHRGAGID